MGKITGFIDYKRIDPLEEAPLDRINHYNEFHTLMSKDKQSMQGARCMDCGVPFCQAGQEIGGMVSGCPLNNLVPEWNDLIYLNNWEMAYSRLKKTNPFPEFTGRVCPALCENACTCGIYDSPVASRTNELSIVEYAYENGLAKANPPQIRTGKKVAIIGSGPSALSAAYYLNRRGHSVQVYERSDRVGGLLMYGIPNMKLDKAIIDRRVKMMGEEGVVFITNADVGRDFPAKQIMESHDAVVLACGSSEPRDIKVPGREGGGIYFAVDYLSATTKSLLNSKMTDGKYISAKGKKVVIIGGGDTGNDCLATSIRHGAKSVTQLEMMPKLPEGRTLDNPWPQWPKVCKTDYGQKEAIALFGKDPRIYETTVKEFKLDKNNMLEKVVVVNIKKEIDAKTGVAVFNTVEGSEREIQADMVLIAAGFTGAQKYVLDAFGVKKDKKNNVATKSGSYETNVDKVFAAGDMRRGQSLVVWAIREGKDVAREVDEKLMGYSNM